MLRARLTALILPLLFVAVALLAFTAPSILRHILGAGPAFWRIAGRGCPTPTFHKEPST